MLLAFSPLDARRDLTNARSVNDFDDRAPPDGSAPPEGGIFGLDVGPDEADVVLIPVPWEATTSYGRGTAAAPAAILRASVQIELFDVELGEPARAGIAMLPEDAELLSSSRQASEAARRVIAAFDAGGRGTPSDLAIVEELSSWRDAWLRREVGSWVDAGKLVGVVGGDHSVAFGSIAAHTARTGSLGVLHIDAHADMRVAYQGFASSHASVMQRLSSELPAVSKVVSVGLRDLCAEEHEVIAKSDGKVVAFFDADLARQQFSGTPFAALCQQMAEALPERVYVTFDIDGLDPSLCPHSGTPVPGGLSFNQATAVLSAVVESGRRIVGFDLCEVAPGPAGDEWDANVGARVLYKLIGYALASRSADR